MSRAAACVSLACWTLLACGGGDTPDASAPLDAGVSDGGPSDSAPPDAGPAPDPEGEMALDWTMRVESAQRLGGVAESRLAAAPGGLVLSVTLGGAPAVFDAGGASPMTIGATAEDDVTQALAWITDDGALTSARAVAVSDPVMSEFAALGWDVETLPDGTAFVAGRFEGGTRFGGDDPLAETFQTLRLIDPPNPPVTSGDAYVARFDPSHTIEWAERGETESATGSHRVVDLALLADGSSIALGIYTEAITLGGVRLAMSAGDDQGTFIARFEPDGALSWARRLRGTSEARAIEAFADGSFVVAVRYSNALVLGEGEPGETTLAAPPEGTRFWDALARFNSAGELAWAVRMGSDATTYPGFKSMRLEGDTIIVGGTFRGELGWPEQPSVDVLRLYGAEVLLAQLDGEGVVRSQTRIRAVRDVQLQALASTTDGGTWVAAGVSRDGATFAPVDGPMLVLPGDATLDTRLVLLRFDVSLDLRAAQLLGASQIDADDLMLTAGGDLILAARYGEGTVLEPGTSAERPLPDAGSFRNVFVARYRPR